MGTARIGTGRVPPCQNWSAKQLTQEYPYTAASLVSLAVTVLAYRIGLRVMKKLP